MGEMAVLLAEMSADLGRDTLDRVLARTGGMRLYVPTEERLAGSTVEQLLGPIVARWLSVRRAADWVDLPCERALTARFRARHLIEAVAREPETPVNQLANRLQVSHRRILQLRAAIRAREPEPEPPLLALARTPSHGPGG